MSDLNEIQLDDGTVRRLGNIIPPTTAMRFTWTEYGATPAAPLVPRDQWLDLIKGFGDGPDYPFLPSVHDQNGVGQCNCDSTTALAESCRMSQGLEYVQLSAADLYDRINGGTDNGSLLEDAMAEMERNGVGTAATCGTIWKRGMKTATSAERARFRALEVFLCPTYQHCMSAVLSGFRLSSGIMWYDNYTPGADGWLPRPKGRSGGHAVFGYKPAMRMVNGQPEYGIWHQNSWGPKWGLGGRCVFPESSYVGNIGGWWAVRVMTDEGGVIPIPTS